MNTEVILALLGALGLTIPGILAFLRGLKADKIDGASKLTDSAIKLINSFEVRIKELENVNQNLEKNLSETEEWKILVSSELELHTRNSELNKARIQELETEVATLRGVREELTSEVVALQSQITALQEERTSLVDDNRLLLDRISNLEKKLKEQNISFNPKLDSEV